MNYTTNQFIEIIESEGTNFIRSDYIEGYHTRTYQNPNGLLIIIDTTEEDIEDEIMKGYLIELCFANLIPALFPTEIVPSHEELKAKKAQEN